MITISLCERHKLSPKMATYWTIFTHHLEETVVKATPKTLRLKRRFVLPKMKSFSPSGFTFFVFRATFCFPKWRIVVQVNTVFSRTVFAAISRKIRPGFHHTEKLARECISWTPRKENIWRFSYFRAKLNNKFIYFQGQPRTVMGHPRNQNYPNGRTNHYITFTIASRWRIRKSQGEGRTWPKQKTTLAETDVLP